MAQKYTILKAITRTSNKGFTLLELLVGMTITLIVGGLAMQAFINASATFSKDKKSIDSNQNLSAVLDIIGNDIKQAGENIIEDKFPTIEFAINTDSGSMSGSSKITVRRALTSSLTLCETIVANTDPTSLTKLIVADTQQTDVCKVGTSTSQLLGARTSTTVPPSSVNYTLPLATSPAPVTLTPLLPAALRNARDYRCQLFNPNPTSPYDSLANATTDFCTGGADSQTVRVAVSDGNGHIIVFNQTGEEPNPSNVDDSVNPSTYTTSTIKQYWIKVDTTTPSLGTITTNNNTRNQAVAYGIGSPIYLIEERVYTLDTDGNLKVSIDGGTASTLIKRIGKFNVSARRYIDTTNRVINPKPATADTTVTPNIPAEVPTADICADSPAAADATIQNPQYICKFNYNTLVTDTAMNWKKIAGVRINLQAKYDGNGGVSETSTVPADIAAVNAAKEKLTATAEFFPRNVLSK